MSDDDVTSSIMPMPATITNAGEHLSIAFYALAVGVTDDGNFQTLFSEPVFIGYVSLYTSEAGNVAANACN